MPFDWSNLIELARVLEQQSAGGRLTEALLRSAVSRAYFGAFGYANRYAVDFLQYRSRSDADEHGRLREHLRRKKRKAVAERLFVLRSWRNDADYLNDLPWADVTGTVVEAIRQAQEVLAALPPPQPRQN